jgi:hypothetical protein
LLADDVRRFLANQLDERRTPSNASQLAGALRSYLRYRTTCGDQVGALTAVISNPVHWKLAKRPVAKPGHEAELKKRTLTNLYNARPAWLDMAHKQLDQAVAAASGWSDYMPEMPAEEILCRLLALNLNRAARPAST